MATALTLQNTITDHNRDKVKSFYVTHHDRINNKRHNSPYWLRRYAHHQIYAQFLPHLRPGQRVLDAGCGEGGLSCLVATHGFDVVGADISAPNVAAAQALAQERGLEIPFFHADAENLPFADNSFDVVLSSHVLEHLPDLARGLSEIYRITRSTALIAMPTCLNPACWAILGGDTYWKISRRSAGALPSGLFKTLRALALHAEGPDEGYAGNCEVPHIWRFPWVMRQWIERAGFAIERFEAGPLIVPYLAEYLPALRGLQPRLDRRRGAPILRELGYGSLAVCRKRNA